MEWMQNSNLKSIWCTDLCSLRPCEKCEHQCHCTVKPFSMLFSSLLWLKLVKMKVHIH